MRVFFLSEKPCALFVNGLLLGNIDGFERSVELDPADGVLCECKPERFHTLRFRFDETFLFAPPPEAKLYFTRTGVAVYLSGFQRIDQSLRVVARRNVGGTTYTLCVQGRVRLISENGSTSREEILPDAFENAALHEAGEFLLIEGDDCFCLADGEGRIVLQSDGHVMERGARLVAEVPLKDCRRHTALCTWEGGVLKACTLRAAGEPTEATFAVALFESALIGADCAPFLSPALQEKAGALKEFLGDFLSVVVTPDPAVVGLVYRERERVYEVRYFVVETTDGKISNITPVE